MLPTPSTSHVSFERVYEPSEDSFLLLDTLSGEEQKSFLQERFSTSTACPVVVEVGIGSGVVLAFATAHAKTIFGRDDILALGFDLNQYACHAARETVVVAQDEQRAQLASCGVFLDNLSSDLVTCLRPEMVDVLIFNPPYVPTLDLPEFPAGLETASAPTHRDEDLLALSYAGGRDGMEVTNRLLEDLPRILCDRGCAYILLCAQNKPEEVKQRIRSWGSNWRVETVSSSGKKGGWEKLQVIRIWRLSVDMPSRKP